MFYSAQQVFSNTNMLMALGWAFVAKSTLAKINGSILREH